VVAMNLAALRSGRDTVAIEEEIGRIVLWV
jgi:hypothetical protein